MHTTDYTKPDSTMVGPILPSRFGAYLLDLVKQWFSDPRQRLFSQLSGIRFKEGDLPEDINESTVFMDIEWPESQVLADKTPAVVVSFGQTAIQPLGMGQQVFVGTSHYPGEVRTYDLAYDVNINIRTQAYAGSQYITEQLMLYLSTNRHVIQQDANLALFAVTGMTAPVLNKQPGDSKDVFISAIVCRAVSRFTAAVDTIGPVFRGVEIRSEITNNGVASSS